LNYSGKKPPIEYGLIRGKITAVVTTGELIGSNSSA